MQLKPLYLIAAFSVIALGSVGISAYYKHTHPKPPDTGNSILQGKISRDKLTGIKVVDMIPLDLSAEENADSEPFLTIDPGNPKNMAATAFTPNPADTGLSPLFVSHDGGDSWILEDTIPSVVMTADMTESSEPGGLLHAALLAHRTDAELKGRLPVQFRAADTGDFGSSTEMVVRGTRFKVDQPWVVRARIADRERVFIGSNDFNDPSGHTATVDISPDSGKTFKTVRLEMRKTALQDGPSVRMAVAADGKIYAAYLAWRRSQGEINYTDVVVARDDHEAAGDQPFHDLVDSDGLPGRIVTSVQIPFINWATLGQERIGSTLSLAVDPRNSSTVYIAWGDRVGDGDIYSIHVRRSVDGGKTWSDDLRRLKDATCAALALTPNGTVGFLYQQVDKASGTDRWVTHVEQTRDAFRTIQDTVLATVPANEPDWGESLPYIGDYNFLATVGEEFRGVFSANNTPKSSNFPNGIRFLRRVDMEKNVLLRKSGQNPGQKQVNISIDPFFFVVPGIK